MGLGCNNFGSRMDLEAVEGVFHACLDSGVTFFDTADVYGNGASEELLGQVIKGHRDEVVIASKFGYAGVDLGLTGPAVGRVLARIRSAYLDGAVANREEAMALARELERRSRPQRPAGRRARKAGAKRPAK